MKLLYLILILFGWSLHAHATSQERYTITEYTTFLNESDTLITNSILKEKDARTALVLCVLLGPLGVHRLYLGTQKTTVVAYVLTAAGFGVLWVTDTILLTGAVFKKDVSRYSGNRHFFLWNN